MNIIERSEWGAAPPTGGYSATTWGSRGVVHHTAEDTRSMAPKVKRPGIKWFGAKYRMNRQVQKLLKAYRNDSARVQELEAKNMRFMQGYHQSKGWTDIGYHFVIYPSGRVYRGRPPYVWGAHALNGNYMPGISFAANTEVQKLTPAALAAFEALCHELNLTSVIGHRWVPGNATACPGKNGIEQLHLNKTTGIARV